MIGLHFGLHNVDRVNRKPVRHAAGAARCRQVEVVELGVVRLKVQAAFFTYFVPNNNFQLAIVESVSFSLFSTIIYFKSN